MGRRGRPKHPDILTLREWEVLALLREGLTNEQIAERLNIGLRTARHHVSQILSKLNVSSRQEAARWEGEPRPWWAALLPLWKPAASAIAGTAAVVVVAGISVMIWALTRTSAAQPLDLGGQTWTEAEARVEPPAFLETPLTASGEEWSVETRVSNLGELELVAAVQEFPTRISLVDAHSGEAVATGEFGGDVNVRFRDTARQLLVADTTSDGDDRLLIFGISDVGLSLLNQVTLPERTRYKGFFNQMFLSPDEHQLFVSLRRYLDIPSCQGPHSAMACYDHAVGIVDLDARQVDVVDYGTGCDFTWLRDVGTVFPVWYCGSGLGSPKWFAVSDGALRAIDVEAPEGTDFIRQDDESTRALVNRGGQILDSEGELVGSLARDGATWMNITEHLQGDLVLVGINPPAPSDTLATELRVADLSDGTILLHTSVPLDLCDVTVLDASRALLFVGCHDEPAIHQLDLRTGDVVRTLPIHGMSGQPSGMER